MPALAKVPKAQIRKALGVSEPCSIYIQTGRVVPHKRHWERLADLAGLKSSGFVSIDRKLSKAADPFYAAENLKLAKRRDSIKAKSPI